MSVAPADTRPDVVRRVVTAAERVPLRVRLVAILTVLALLALTATGAAAVTLLRGQLVGKIDDQLLAQSRAAGLDDEGLGSDRPGRLPTATYGAIVLDDGRVVVLGRRLDEGAPTPRLTGITSTLAAERALQPYTVLASRGIGRWRVVLRPVTVAGARSASGALVVAQPLDDVDDTVRRMRALLALTGLTVLLATVLLGYWAVRRSLRPLTEIEEVAATIAGGDLSRRVPERPRTTEVGRLGAALNVMLSQIESAFAARAASESRMRRFVADASHELRTPLATVRGYAELYRQGAVTGDEAVSGAMRRIEGEATRMGVLVEDLLVLARLDDTAARSTAPRTDVDLTVLAGDAAQDIRALAPDRPVAVLGLAGPLGPVPVRGDEPRLRQVLTNLVANALHHTPPGTPVELAVGVQTDTGTGGRPTSYAVLEVRDHGPGLSAEESRKVFERFYRADPSRTRDTGGSGLGLAIVAAVVGAHDGRVGVRPTDAAGGATFVVRLPLAAPEAPRFLPGTAQPAPR